MIIFVDKILDNCNQVGVVCESVFASVEAVNCQKLQLQVNGISPTLQLDNSQNVTIYVQKEHRDKFEFITAGIGAVNCPLCAAACVLSLFQ